MSQKYQSVADFLVEHTDLIDSNGNKISDWCREERSDYKVYCVFCKCSISVNLRANQRITYIMYHSKTLKHRTAFGIKSGHQDGLENYQDDEVKSSRASKVKSSAIKSPLSKYEMMLEEKRAKNRELLQSLGIDEVKSDLAKVKNSMKKKTVRKISERPDLIIQRASKRLKEHVDYVEELPLTFDGLSQKFYSSEMSFKKALKYNTSSHYKNFVKDFSEIIKADDNVIEDPVLYDKDTLRRLSAKASSKISDASAMSWFPSTENLVLAVGDARGNLNLSNFKESYLDFHAFSVHSERISKVQYNPFNPFQLISSGIDGKVLCCDMQAQKFNEVLNTSERGCTYFDFIASFSYVVSLTTGEVIILDSREHRLSHKVPVYQQTDHKLHRCSIRSVNVHPINKNYFVSTAAGENAICIWDLRHLSSPVIKNTNHKKNVVSAAFSPASGKFLLSKSKDEIGIFDCTSMTRRRMECHKIMKYTDSKSMKEDHSRPVWLPNSDDNFACNVQNSSLLHIFDKDLNIYGTLSEGTPGTQMLIAFHPFQAALAYAMRTSKIYVYL